MPVLLEQQGWLINLWWFRSWLPAPLDSLWLGLDALLHTAMQPYSLRVRGDSSVNASIWHMDVWHGLRLLRYVLTGLQMQAVTTLASNI